MLPRVGGTNSRSGSLPKLDMQSIYSIRKVSSKYREPLASPDWIRSRFAALGSVIRMTTRADKPARLSLQLAMPLQGRLPKPDMQRLILPCPVPRMSLW